MVAPHLQLALPPSLAEPNTRQNFALHPATSARTGCIHRASEYAVIPNHNGKAHQLHAGGHSGPPLRGGFVSIGAIIKAEPNTKQ